MALKITRRKLLITFQIFYCSRTHSQLSQFVKEIQKTKFAEDIRLISLASRTNMCINESVLSLKNSTMINEKCLEMQKKKSKKKSQDLEPPAKKKRTVNSTSGCPYYKSGAIQSLRDQSLLQVQDIEQLVEKGAILLKSHTTQCGKDKNLLTLEEIREIDLLTVYQ